MSWRAIKWARRQRVGSASAKASLVCLAHHADENGYCWPSQETVSAETEISVDSVQRAFKKYLEPRFLRRIKRKSSDGRRISDGYQLTLDYETSNRQSNSCGPASCGLVGQGNQAADHLMAKPQIDASPSRAMRLKSLNKNNQESSGRTLRSMPGGARLEKRLGKGAFDSWFAAVVFVEQRNQVLILQADSLFLARHIEQQFDPQIVECFRPEFKTAVRVKVLVRTKESPEGGGAQKSGCDVPGPAS